MIFTLAVRTRSTVQGVKNEAPLAALTNGFRAFLREPMLLWLGLLLSLMNFAMAPLAIALPVLARQAKAMPAWYLGALEAAVGVGAIFGAVIVARCESKWGKTAVVVGAVTAIGIGLTMLANTGGLTAPLALLALVGAAAACANVPLGTQLHLALPDSHRGRVGALLAFMSSVAAPLGLGVAGAVIQGIGLTTTLWLIGASLILLAPAMLLIPRFSAFMAAPSDEAPGFFTLG